MSQKEIFSNNEREFLSGHLNRRLSPELVLSFCPDRGNEWSSSENSERNSPALSFGDQKVSRKCLSPTEKMIYCKKKASGYRAFTNKECFQPKQYFNRHSDRGRHERKRSERNKRHLMLVDHMSGPSSEGGKSVDTQYLVSKRHPQDTGFRRKQIHRRHLHQPAMRSRGGNHGLATRKEELIRLNSKPTAPKCPQISPKVQDYLFDEADSFLLQSEMPGNFTDSPLLSDIDFTEKGCEIFSSSTFSKSASFLNKSFSRDTDTKKRNTSMFFSHHWITEEGTRQEYVNVQHRRDVKGALSETEILKPHIGTAEHVTKAMGVLDSLEPLDINACCILSELSDETGSHLPDPPSRNLPHDREISGASETDPLGQAAETIVQTSTSFCGQIAEEEMRPGAKPSSQLPPCRICAQPASGFHYGVNSCEACKGFFRRCLTRRRPFYCKGGKGDCDVSRTSGSTCAYCRYKRCQSLGMSKDAIRIGRYTHETRTQNTLEVRMLQQGEFPLCLPDEEVDAVIERLVTVHDNLKRTCLDLAEEDKMALWRQVRELAMLQQETFGPLEAVDFKEFDEIYRLTGLEIDNRKESMERSAQAVEKNVLVMIEFAKSIPGFTDLTASDQISLLRAGRADYTFLGRYQGYSLEHQAFASPVMRGLHRSHFDRLFGKELVDFQFHLAESFKRLHLSKQEVILLKAISLTFPDRCDLVDYTSVEQLNWNLIRCFLTLVERREGNGVMLSFAKVIDRLTALRAMSEMIMKAFANPLFMEALSKKPVLVEMLLQ